MNESATSQATPGDAASQEGDDAGGESTSGLGDSAEEGPERSSAQTLPELEIDLTLETDQITGLDAQWLRRHLSKVMAAAGVEHGSFSLVIVDDVQMTDLHVQYRNEAGTTDVLTFDLRDSSEDDANVAALDGEVIICVDEAVRQAADRGHEVRLELLLYAVHGLLHLLGYDDPTESEFQRMHECEDQLLQAVGLEPVFATGR